VGNVFGVMAVCAALATTPGIALQPTGVPHSADLSAPRVDVIAGGETIISLTATGELKGIVTLKLRRTANGTLTGDWAFTVAHVDNSDPATGVEPPSHPQHEHGDGEHEHAHRDFVTMVHRGALAGTVSDAQLTFDSEGALAELSATLTIAQGSSEFAGATGTGQATLKTLTLFF
jgi:hypothetical protein